MSIERIVPGTIEWESFYANHICRYEFAKNQLDSSIKHNILDAACGVGYGSAFLAENNLLKIVAMDKSKEALEIARKQFQKENILFMEDDCNTLQTVSVYAPFDVIVSFETIEHLPDSKKFLLNAFSLLKAGGKLIISSPNQQVSSPEGNLTWDFHEKEYDAIEFCDLLTQSGFSKVSLFGQHLSSIGKLRDQFRAELNKLNSNPFIRIGKKCQQLFRGHKFAGILPEQAEDFEIIEYNVQEDIIKMGKKGPFVLLAVCTK